MSEPTGRSTTWLRRAEPFAGPALIVALVLVLLRGFAFGGLITNQHPDILPAWLPFHCFLGRGLRSGHIPSWNPFAMGGVPATGDPQSGWMYLPAMLLYTALPCAAAIRWFVVLQPLLTGLGLYAFLRIERASRPAATAGGLVIALLMASSALGLELPFAGVLAWTSLGLAAAAKMLRASSWPGRLLWLAAVAVAWGQIAAAHLSHGLVVGSLTILAYVAARLASDVRAGGRPRSEAWLLAGLLLASLPLVNLAYLVPRIAYVPRTTLGLGYNDLAARAAALAGRAPPPATIVVGGYRNLSWPLGLMVSPGSYLGAVTAALVFASWWTRRHRAMVIAFSVSGAICYLATLNAVARLLAPRIAGLPFADFYYHSTLRFRFGVILAIPILAALGLDAWLEHRTVRQRLMMVAPGVVVWWILPFPLSLETAAPKLFLVGVAAAVTGLALAAMVVRPHAGAPRRIGAGVAAWGLIALIAAELLANGLIGQRDRYPRPGAHPSFWPLRPPTVDAAAYLRPDLVIDEIRADGPDLRVLPLSPKGLDKPGRKRLLLDPSGWGLEANQRSMLFGLQDVDGYNPDQLLRYWSFVRAVDPRGLKYNSAFFARATPLVLDELSIGWVIAGANLPPPIAGLTPTLGLGPWELYAVDSPSPRATLLTSWERVTSPDAALDAVTAPGFDPSATAVLEPSADGVGPPAASVGGSSAGTATYRSLGPQSASVEVDAPETALILIRNVYDPNWRATVDGRSAPLYPADGLIQSVLVSEGHHLIELDYDDPSTGYGLLGSAFSLGALLGMAGALSFRRRRAAAPADLSPG